MQSAVENLHIFHNAKSNFKLKFDKKEKKIMAMFEWRILKCYTCVDEAQNFQHITDEEIIYRYNTICNHQLVIKNRRKIDNIYQDKYLKVLIANF